MWFTSAICAVASLSPNALLRESLLGDGLRFHSIISATASAASGPFSDARFSFGGAAFQTRRFWSTSS